MKKLLSIFTALIILSLSVVAPFSALAKDKNNDEGIYIVSDEIYADGYMLINLDDDNYPVIAQKNKDKKMYPASLTKIATAMVIINNVKDLKAETKVSKSAIDVLANTYAQVAGLEVGETVSIQTLLDLIMVHSACDACTVAAEFVGGTIPEFVKLMNNWAKSLGCTGTNFVNCDGLHDDNHYTTPSDMAIMTLEAIKNETFLKACTKKSVEFHDTTLIHTNFMLDPHHLSYYYEYAEGIKTGSTSQAGYCVITKASKNGYNYLAVVMGSPIKKIDGIDTKCSFIDAATLFDWAFDSLKYSVVVKGNDVVCEIPVEDGKDADSVQLGSNKDITALVPASLNASAVMIKPVDPPEKLNAPIVKDEKICEADVYYANKIVATVDLCAMQTVELSTFLKIVNAVKSFLSNKIVLAVIVLLIILLIIYIAVFASRLKKAKKRSIEKRRRREQLDEQVNREYQQQQRNRRNGRDDYLPPPRR